LSVAGAKESDCSEEEIEQGVTIVEEMLQFWASQSAGDSEDVEMLGPDSDERQLSELKQCMERFKPQIEGNQWLQKMLTVL
jgi:DNA mismatch repair protein MSH2